MAKSSRASAPAPQSHSDGRRPAVAPTAGAVGPCSPIPGPNSIEFSGSRLALERNHGVDLSGLGDERGHVYEANDTQGHTWFVRRGGVGLYAFRERTAEESAAEQDERQERACKTIAAFRLTSARLIALELAAIAEQISPDRRCTRASLRCLKRRMRALSMLQFDLLAGAQSATSARTRMQALGLFIPEGGRGIADASAA